MHNSSETFFAKEPVGIHEIIIVYLRHVILYVVFILDNIVYKAKAD